MPRPSANLHGSLLGPAPRAIVHALCRRPTDVTLGDYRGRRKCPRCLGRIEIGVVVQEPAPSTAKGARVVALRATGQEREPDGAA